MALIDLYNQSKDYAKVVKALDLLEKKSGKTEQISMEKFRMYLLMEDNKKAFNEIESLANEYPNDMRYLCVLGDVYLNNGKPKEAYATYQKVLETEPGNTQVLVSLASYYQQTGQLDKYELQVDSVLLNKKVESDIKADIMRQMIAKSQQTGKDSTRIIPLFNRMMEGEQEDAQIPMWGGYAAYLIKQKYDIPYVITEHRGRFGLRSTLAKEGFIPVYKPFLEKGFSNASYVIPVSQQLIDKIKEFLLKEVPIEVVSNILDTDFFHYLPRERTDNFTFITVNSFSQPKGYDILLPAFDRLCNNIPNVMLVIVGDNFEDKTFQKILSGCMSGLSITHNIKNH